MLMASGDLARHSLASRTSDSASAEWRICKEHRAKGTFVSAGCKKTYSLSYSDLKGILFVVKCMLRLPVFFFFF